jgi:hypothetical protein
MSEENAVMKTEKKELAEQNSFASKGNLEILQEALGGGECTGLTFRFDRIKIPSGGSLAFEVPGDEEETEMAKTITAVIAFTIRLSDTMRQSFRAAPTHRTVDHLTVFMAQEIRAASAGHARITSLDPAGTSPRPARTATCSILCAKARFSRW